MDYQYLRIRKENRVGWLEYNRPPINAFNWEMPAALDELQKNSGVRVIVVASAIEKYFKDFSEGIRAFLEKREPQWK